jgi:acyl carrier protein
MKQDSLKERVYRVVSQVLGVPVAELAETSGPDSIKAWDSVSHLNLVLALEGEFSVTLSDEDVLDMLSVGLILTILKDKGVTDVADA